MKRKMIALMVTAVLSLCLLSGCETKTESAKAYVQPVTAVSVV